MGKYEYQSRVRYSECGEDCRLHLPGAVNYFQDAATFQGEDLGIGIPWMKEHHLAWILVSWQIIMDHMPRLGEPIRVSTWAYDFRSFYGLRNLLLEDEKGQPAVWANSVWVLMNTADRRPAKVSDSMIALYGQEEKLEMANQQNEEAYETTVYSVFGDDAIYYHASKVCRTQTNGRELTVRDALRQGLQPCPYCNPPTVTA